MGNDLHGAPTQPSTDRGIPTIELLFFCFFWGRIENLPLLRRKCKAVFRNMCAAIILPPPNSDLQVFQSPCPAEISSRYCLLLPKKKKETDSDHQKELYLLYFS